ncbi:unnamed protein product [Rotaria magnacalcarata]|uniref:Uncharacterized protein n=1 Tax=Rotaria magnacalcarata TaxID=392030 RepID=A0A816PSF0_9BILA|nr:unnamed protein product [Rotaria magnacalcarata]CAF1598305.1 unnamed protein product [Rotaria magnacalcarata]CAF2052470.1 unnamed protein product [Rotaria magnacalcarata]
MEAHHGSSTDSSVTKSPNRDSMITITKELKELNHGIVLLNEKMDKILEANDKIFQLNQKVFILNQVILSAVVIGTIGFCMNR